MRFPVAFVPNALWNIPLPLWTNQTIPRLWCMDAPVSVWYGYSSVCYRLHPKSNRTKEKTNEIVISLTKLNFKFYLHCQERNKCDFDRYVSQKSSAVTITACDKFRQCHIHRPMDVIDGLILWKNEKKYFYLTPGPLTDRGKLTVAA